MDETTKEEVTNPQTEDVTESPEPTEQKPETTEPTPEAPIPDETAQTEAPVEENPAPDAVQTIDYKQKFSESSKENQRIRDEAKRVAEENESLKRLLDSSENTGTDVSGTPEELYPGFQDLDEDQQKQIISFTNNVTKKVYQEIYKDPAVAFAKQTYNEKKFNEALDKVVAKRPELKEARDDFKAKYFKPQNVPENIENILDDLSKIYLYDKARDIGAREAMEKSQRIDLERSGGGDKTPHSSRSLEEWQRLAEANPSEFAKLSADYQKDLESGKLK
jgi:signal recognition particle subunit SEC65